MRAVRSRVRDEYGTRRFTIGWVLALVVVGTLALSSTRAFAGALQHQERVLRLGAEIDTAQRLTTDLAATGQRLTRPGEIDLATLVDLTRLHEEVAAQHAVVTTSDGTLAPVSELGPTTGTSAAAGTADPDVDATFGAVDAAAVALLSHTRDVRGTGQAGPQDQEYAQDLARTAADHRATLAQLRAVRFASARGELGGALRTANVLLVVLLTVLVLAGLLVFRPTLLRVERLLEHRSREAEEDRRRSEQQLESLARYDHLTGLANRMMFRDRLQHAVESARRSGKHVAVMFIDLDKFKDVNDQLGHDAGDELLVQAGQRLQEIARRTDTIARIGGDEFTVILENLDTPDGAATVAQKILTSLAEPIAIGDREVQVTASIGIATFPDDARSAEDLLRNADTAMYSAKTAGKNTFQFSTPELREATLARLQMVQDLRAAVAAKRLRLVYQPQISLATDEIVGVEALVRWMRTDGEEVPAAHFIGIAEDTDLMVPLGEWVVAEACRQAARWQREGLPPLRVAVNLSGRQFRQSNVVTMIASALQESGLHPSFLELEVTEASLVEDVESSTMTLRLLKGIGVRVAIDDFGTGYSSLNYLKEFPIDVLKIDDSFLVPDATGDDHVVPTAIADLARHLGMETTAEGVETEEQLEFLRTIGVDRAQGYHLSPPVDAEALTDLVRRPRVAPVTDLHVAEDAG